MEIEDDKQWKPRAAAAELVAQALDVLKSGGIEEHGALSALEDALETRRTSHNLQAAGN
jgi:hypothetical protein